MSKQSAGPASEAQQEAEPHPPAEPQTKIETIMPAEEQSLYSQPTVAPPETFLAHETGIRHIAFYVDDPQKELDRLISLGGSALGSLPEGGGAVYARDPFGNMIELCKIPSPEESPTRLPGVSSLSDLQFQYTDQPRFFEPAVKYAGVIEFPEQADEVMREAFRQALTGKPGPVFVELSSDKQYLEVEFGPLTPPENYRLMHRNLNLCITRGVRSLSPLQKKLSYCYIKSCMNFKG